MNIGVIFAGGVGSRMHSKDIPKQFLKVHDKPIMIHTLEHFEKNDMIDAIVISCIASWIPHLKELLYKYRIEKVKKVVAGGESGQLSIYNGLCAAKEVAGERPAIVLIHDGVRPLIDSELLTKNVMCVKEHGSAITTGIVKETIAVVDENGCILHVPSRADSRVAKAPQSFWLSDIFGVHEKAMKDGITNAIDSCTLMTQYGYKLYTVDGPYENIKITTPDDFYTMRAILDAKENSQIYGYGEDIRA
ncbi:MAG: 2-C-methyl-D-erythritol 4-phosphate cytidylyltransferase [Clostridiales bacterium]|nr:2-C-methyl-D-erythritol 4-phosphate cytidylyltransferase [Clostridiales bacterium]